jgi:Domain of unknown function (DUF4112)
LRDRSYLPGMATIFSSAWSSRAWGSRPWGSRAWGSSSPETRQATLVRLDRLARLFDTAFIVPGTNIRFGVEAVMRLVPGIGDAAASALSCYLLYEAYRLGVPWRVFARMILNVVIEGAAGTVPFAGDAFDVAFRANRRNVRLLREYFEQAGWA